MARSPSAESPLSTEPFTELSTDDAERMFEIADGAILRGLRGRRPTVPSESGLSPALRRRAGVFVTLSVGGRLNGCIGSLEGDDPIGVAVALNAWSAAFADPRLPALSATDYEDLSVEISVLSALVAVPAGSRQEVLGGLRHGVDGLVIAHGRRRGVFLPSVWEQLPDPGDFLDHLRAKAGLRPGSWPEGMRAWRFTVTRYTSRARERSSRAEVG